MTATVTVDFCFMKHGIVNFAVETVTYVTYLLYKIIFFPKMCKLDLFFYAEVLAYTSAFCIVLKKPNDIVSFKKRTTLLLAQSCINFGQNQPLCKLARTMLICYLDIVNDKITCKNYN